MPVEKIVESIKEIVENELSKIEDQVKYRTIVPGFLKQVYGLLTPEREGAPYEAAEPVPRPLHPECRPPPGGLRQAEEPLWSEPGADRDHEEHLLRPGSHGRILCWYPLL